MVSCTIASSTVAFAGAFVVFAMLITPNSADILIPQYLPNYLTGPFVRRSLPLGRAIQEEVEENTIPVNVKNLLVGHMQHSNKVPKYLQGNSWAPKNIRLGSNEGYGNALKTILMRMATN